MKIIRNVLKIAACILGSAVSVSFLFAMVTILVLGPYGTEHEVQFREAGRIMRSMEQWIPFVWFFGAVLGGLIVSRSERERVPGG